MTRVKILAHLTLYLVLLIKCITCECVSIAESVANSVDSDQTPRLLCLLGPVCPNSYSKYGSLIKSNPSEILNPLLKNPGSAIG